MTTRRKHNVMSLAIRSDFGRWFKREREAAGLIRQRFAEHGGNPSEWERGTAYPNPKALELIEGLLGPIPKHLAVER